MVIGPELLGVSIILVGCLFLATQNLLLSKGTFQGRAYDGILIVISINVVVLVPLVLVWYYPDYGLTTSTLLAFAAAGLAGTMLARACKYVSIGRIGASRTEPIAQSNALVATILSVIFLGEVVTPIHLLAIVAIIAGVAFISWETTRENPRDLSRRELALGLMLPVGSAVFFGIEPIFASYALSQGTPAPVGVAIKSVAALIGFVCFLSVRGELPSVDIVRVADTRFFLIAGVLNTVFVLGYYSALSLAPVSLVTPILPTSSLLTVVLAALFMPKQLEAVTARLVGAALLVVVGVVALTIMA